MKRICFVCHGNICRSPLGEFILKDIVRRHNKSDEYLIVSRATSFEEIGNGIYPPIKRVLLVNNIPTTRHYATRVEKSDYDKYDYFLCMDNYNISNLKFIFNDKDKKIHLLSEFVGFSGIVEDPWYTSRYNEVYKQIYEYCLLLFAKIEEGL